MRQHTVPENLLKQAVNALRAQAHYHAGYNPYVVEEKTSEYKAADELEAIMKHPAAKPHVARTHRPAHNI